MLLVKSLALPLFTDLKRLASEVQLRPAPPFFSTTQQFPAFGAWEQKVRPAGDHQ